LKDSPKCLKDRAEILARKQLLKQRHSLPLTRFVEGVRQEQGKYIPYVDPLDGGINAKCLFVLEAPGPKTKESGFVSRNNNDESAKNFFELNAEAGIPREETVTWNIVPWYIGTDKKIRAAASGDIKEGLLYLYQLVELLVDLKLMVLVGRKAQRVSKQLSAKYSGVQILHCYHPSPQFINRKPENRLLLLNQLKEVEKVLTLRS